MAEPFHKRFNVDVEVDEARRRFVERIRTLTWSLLNQLYLTDRHDMNSLLQAINFHLGERHHPVSRPSEVMQQWDAFVGDSFPKCLNMTEAVRAGLVIQRYSPKTVAEFIKGVTTAVQNSEFDLEISWDGKIFTRKGAELLDEKLVNEPLEWLGDPKYRNVLIPFEKGLKHWMEGQKNPERYGDVITDVYEAIEALAKLVTGKRCGSICKSRKVRRHAWTTRGVQKDAQRVYRLRLRISALTGNEQAENLPIRERH